MAAELTVSTGAEGKNGRLKNENSHRTGGATSHRPCGGPRRRAHVCVLARRGAAVDPAAARGLRTGRDAALPAVRLGHWPCQGVYVPLPSLP
jgi:hypothetical protein